MDKTAVHINKPIWIKVWQNKLDRKVTKTQQVFNQEHVYLQKHLPEVTKYVLKWEEG